MSSGVPAAAAVPTPGQRVEPKLVSFAFKESHKYSFTCDLELDVTDPALSATFELPDVPIRGDWSCTVERVEQDLHLSILHSSLPSGAYGLGSGRMQVSAVLEKEEYSLGSFSWGTEWMPSRYTDDMNLAFAGWRSTIAAVELEPATSGSTYDPGKHRHNASCVNSNLEQLFPLELSPISRDVRFLFPHAPSGGAELWADADFLAHASPFFSSLLSSGVPQEYPMKLSNDTSLQYKQIQITETSFSTYRAVLAYLRTDSIEFAPLSSDCKPLSTDAKHTRRHYLAVSLDAKLPTLVSPKSTYRLAHLLELGALQKICINRLRHVLRPENAPIELFSSVSQLYDDWRKVILDYILDNWDAVMKTDSWKKKKGEIDSRKLPESAPILLELFEAKLATIKKKTYGPLCLSIVRP
ncbi:hypothetical protein NBRC10512v2_004377 [Rhodotorula toruloides]|uniref:BTB/POZ-like domain containing protein n=1 Tax=Rhodotorula toruloides (strain NP11) TaxID=1130832 RepID=M7XKC9_RHOT1|nr:BTB/POZ-like domain containing protein [Rhodotorula toruloides NP11]EMS24319.1 BTB/POZ-like domain containing protein [Rhodotorula toruloides NP11]